MDEGSFISSTTPRSILKKPQESATVQEKAEDGNECGETILPRYISPASTPSAGILKKRRHLFSEDIPLEGKCLKSPPATNTQRRVHFSTTDMSFLASSDDEVDQERSSPRKRFRPTTEISANGLSRQPLGARATWFSTRFLARTVRMVQQVTNNSTVLEADNVSPNAVSSPVVDRSPNTRKDDKLDYQQAICPSLVHSTQPVESVLAQLAPTAWYRSLAMFLKGRDICTIGQLAALSEFQINQLPIRQPKIETVRKVLSVFDKDYVMDGQESENMARQKSPEPLEAVSITNTRQEETLQQRMVQCDQRERSELPATADSEPRVCIDPSETSSSDISSSSPVALSHARSTQTENYAIGNDDLFASSPILISQDVECQTDALIMRESADNLLGLVQSEQLHRLPPEELRVISQTLMLSLGIIFDKLTQAQ